MTFSEIRARADRVRSISLEEVLQLTGARRDRHDRAKWHTARGIISITGMKFMNWNRGAGGGGAIDLAIHLLDLDFKGSVEWLWQHFSNSGLKDEADPPPPRRSLELPAADADNLPRAIGYLVKERGLAPNLIQSLIDSGSLYADRRGNAVFLLLGVDGKPVGAELRGTSPVSWRGLAPGSKKDLGYFAIMPNQESDIVLCESAIDALSCFSIYGVCGCISTAGARPNPHWLPQLIQAGSKIYCGFDADSTGDETADAMMASHPTVKRLRPSLKDWNDVLKSRL